MDELQSAEHNAALHKSDPRRHPPVERILKPRMRAFIDAIVFDDMTPIEAAAKFNYRGTWRRDFEKPHVQAYLKRQCEVLRATGKARNIHRLFQIRDADNNMPAVNAVKTLEGMDAESAMKSTHAVAPGVTIQILHLSPASEIKTINGNSVHDT